MYRLAAMSTDIYESDPYSCILARPLKTPSASIMLLESTFGIAALAASVLHANPVLAADCNMISKGVT